MSFKTFFRPTLYKTILWIFLGLCLFYIFIIISFASPAVSIPNRFIRTLVLVLDILPFALDYIVGTIGRYIPEFLVIILFSFILPWAWYYFLSCLIVWAIDKLRRRSSSDLKEGTLTLKKFLILVFCVVAIAFTVLFFF